MENKVLAFDAPSEAMFMLTDFSDNPDKYPLTAPSGRIEIFSETVAGFGLDGLPGHPVWQAPQEWLGAEAAKTYPLHLATHQPARRLHSQSGQSKFTRAGDVNGRQPPILNTIDAGTLGSADGELNRVFNGRGSCISAAKLSDNVLPGMAMMATRTWRDPDWDNDPACCKYGNANVLTADLPTSGIARGPRALTCLV
jgi:biotin/methionine sulfoxide reductase